MARVFNFSLENPLLKGVLFKKGGLNPGFKRRFFVLYPGFLVYYDDVHKWKVDIWRGNTLGGRSGAVYLKGAVCIKEYFNAKRLRFGISISTPDERNKRKLLELRTVDEAEQETWIAAIKTAIPRASNVLMINAQRYEIELSAEAMLGPEASPTHSTLRINHITEAEVPKVITAALVDPTEAALRDNTPEHVSSDPDSTEQTISWHGEADEEAGRVVFCINVVRAARHCERGVIVASEFGTEKTTPFAREATDSAM